MAFTACGRPYRCRACPLVVTTDVGAERARLRARPESDGDDIVASQASTALTIAAGGGRTTTFDHDGGNFPNDRNHVEFTVEI